MNNTMPVLVSFDERIINIPAPVYKAVSQTYRLICLPALMNSSPPGASAWHAKEREKES